MRGTQRRVWRGRRRKRMVLDLFSCVVAEGHVWVQGFGLKQIFSTQLVPQNTGLQQVHMRHIRNVPDPTGGK